LSAIANLLLLAGYRNRIQDYARRNRGQSLADGLKWRGMPSALPAFDARLPVAALPGTALAAARYFTRR
jgi:hypothetical protein